MPALAAINVTTIAASTATLLSTSATVGIDKTLSPDGLAAPGVQRWVDRSGGIEAGYPRLTIGIRKPTKDSRLSRVTVKLDLPTLATTAPTTSTGIQPAPQVAYRNAFVGEWFFPERGTLAERTVLLSILHSLFVSTITASDGAPTDSTVSPLGTILTTMEPIYGS
jgi:hypothetical protein